MRVNTEGVEFKSFDNVSVIVLSYAEHYVYTLALTISFLWIDGKFPNVNTTLLIDNDINYIIFYVNKYGNDDKIDPEVEVIPPLYVTVFNYEVPRTEFLFTVKINWALLLTGTVHDPEVWPTVKEL